MPLNIKSPEADRLVHALAELTGESKARTVIEALILCADIRIEAITREHADLARQAYLDYGKGNHSARLNFGDGFAYALSKHTDHPLLFKGDDFSKTDILPALD